MDLRLIFASVLAAQACTPYVISPAARSIPLEAAGTVGEDRTAIQAEGGASGEIFGPTIVHGALRVRHGVAEQLELSVEANAMVLAHDSEESNPHPGVYSARVGVKRSFSRHFALTGGLGGGGSAGGGFFAPDVGFIGSYDNPFAVPFLSARLLLSQPFAARTITIRGGDEVVTAQPELTYGFAVATGIRVPVGPRHAPKFALSAGAGFTFLSDGESQHGYPGVSFGIERIY